MLLLRLNDLFKSTFGAFFDISTGVIEERYGSAYHKENEESKVWFLHMGDMDSRNQKIDFQELEVNERELFKKREKRAVYKSTHNLVERNDLKIQDHKLLQISDYLISCRGKIVGYSMKDMEHNEKKQIVYNGRCILPTHHFLTLRPRESSFQDIEYLHFVLDVFIKYQLEIDFNKNILSKGDIVNRELTISYNSDEREEFMKRIREYQAKEKSIQDLIVFESNNYFNSTK